MKSRISIFIGAFLLLILFLPLSPKPTYADMIPVGPGVASFFVLTILLESIPIFAFAFIYKLHLRFVSSAIGVNFISWPVAVILNLPLYGLCDYVSRLINRAGLSSPYISLLTLEVIITIFEGLFIYLINKRWLTMKKSLFISLIMNLTSFLPYLILNHFFKLL